VGSEGHNGIVGAPADADGASQSLSELSLLHQLQEAGVSLNFGGSSDMTEKIVQRACVGGGGGSPPRLCQQMALRGTVSRRRGMWRWNFSQSHTLTATALSLTSEVMV